MAIETPPAAPAAPAVPDRADRANFPVQMHNEFNFINTQLLPYIEGAADNVEHNALEAQARAADAAISAAGAAGSAAAAANSADSAASAAGAPAWVSGTAYTAGQCVWSPASFQTYRARTNTSGTVDPSDAPAVWQRLGGEIPDFFLIQQGVI